MGDVVVPFLVPGIMPIPNLLDLVTKHTHKTCKESRIESVGSLAMAVIHRTTATNGGVYQRLVGSIATSACKVAVIATVVAMVLGIHFYAQQGAEQQVVAATSSSSMEPSVVEKRVPNQVSATVDTPTNLRSNKVSELDRTITAAAAVPDNTAATTPSTFTSTADEMTAADPNSVTSTDTTSLSSTQTALETPLATTDPVGSVPSVTTAGAAIGATTTSSSTGGGGGGNIYNCDTDFVRVKPMPPLLSHVECVTLNPQPMQLPKEGFILGHDYFNSVYERRVADVFHAVLQSQTAVVATTPGTPPQGGIVLDSGGNTGWYTALVTHCYKSLHVIVVEPQINCFQTTCPLLQLNHIDSSRVTIYNNIVANEPTTLTLQTTQGCDPGFSVDSDAAAVVNGTAVDVSSIRGVDLIQDYPEEEPILFAKIDAEGSEISVLTSLEPLFANGRLTDLVVEIQHAPTRWGIALEDNLRELTRLVETYQWTIIPVMQPQKTYTVEQLMNVLRTTVGGDFYFTIQSKLPQR